MRLLPILVPGRLGLPSCCLALASLLPPIPRVFCSSGTQFSTLERRGLPQKRHSSLSGNISLVEQKLHCHLPLGSGYEGRAAFGVCWLPRGADFGTSSLRNAWKRLKRAASSPPSPPAALL